MADKKIAFLPLKGLRRDIIAGRVVLAIVSGIVGGLSRDMYHELFPDTPSAPQTAGESGDNANQPTSLPQVFYSRCMARTGNRFC
jgi:hypothetical protein